MEFFDKENNVRKYIQMSEGYDGHLVIEILKKYLKPGDSILELGMGPGKDLDLMKKDFKVTGSDISRVFLDLYKKKHPDADLIQLDAVSLQTDRKFKCIFSNKVLHHLEKEDLKKSISRQKEVLEPGGVMLHSFWEGDKEEWIEDLRFIYYRIGELHKLFSRDFEILEMGSYEEFEKGDSIYLVLRKR